MVCFPPTAAPDDDDAWEDWWYSPPAPDVLEQRLSSFAHAFDLDGPGPRFLQDLDPLDDADSKEVAALLIDAPGAQTLRNNADLFVKRGVAPVLCRAAAAMALFTLNSYAPAGGAGYRTSLRGGGPMTTLVVAEHSQHGDTLWGRLWPNVESREQIRERAAESKPHDDTDRIFPWLAPTRTSNPKAGGKDTTPQDVHPTQVYWGMPRRIRLQFEEAQGRRCSLTAADDPNRREQLPNQELWDQLLGRVPAPLDAVLQTECEIGRDTPGSPDPPAASATDFGPGLSFRARTDCANPHKSFDTGRTSGPGPPSSRDSLRSAMTWTT